MIARTFAVIAACALVATSCTEYQLVKKDKRKASVAVPQKKPALKSVKKKVQHGSTAERIAATAPPAAPDTTPKVYEADAEGALVTEAWMKEYLELATKHGPSSDGKIEQWGNNFRVNRAVRDHYIEMKLEEKK